MAAIYLIRHGQASFGSTDYDKLSDKGHKQSIMELIAVNRRCALVVLQYLFLQSVLVQPVQRYKRSAHAQQKCVHFSGLQFEIMV